MRIRKEIRQLSLDEWNQVVNAFWIMKKTSTKDGKQKYGNKYVSYDRMVEKHSNAALDIRGDQGHFAPMFAVFHRAWVLEFENSLLSIDDNIKALPYWDFRLDVIDNEVGNKNAFSNEYFGSLQGEPPLYNVIDGQFRYWPIAKVNSNNIERNISISNSYGYLRHPLSINKSPYLTRRGGELCGNHVKSLGSIKQWDKCITNTKDITEWFNCIETGIYYQFL
jgi:hypothetical protein